VIPFHIPGFPDRETSLRALEIQDRSGIAVYEAGTPTLGKCSEQANEVVREAIARGCVADLALYQCRSPVLVIVYEGFVEDPTNLRLLRDVADAILWEWGMPTPELKSQVEAIGLTETMSVNVRGSASEFARAVQRARGLLYVSMGPRTGKRYPWPEIRQASERLRDAPVPVCFGFGVCEVDDIRALRDMPRCDGVIIGTVLLRALRSGLAFYEDCLASLVEAGRV
jgi:tryptophan synthase alpha subunit